jgi:hypothetical protein
VEVRPWIRFLFKVTGAEVRDIIDHDADDAAPHAVNFDGSLWLMFYDGSSTPALSLQRIPMSEVVELKGGGLLTPGYSA